MLETIYVLWDNEAKLALKPLIISKNDVQPIRDVTDVVNNKDSQINRTASSYQLLAIGTIDLESLEISADETRLVAECADLLQQPQG